MTMQACPDCGGEKCPTCGKEKCCGGGAGDAFIDPTAKGIAQDVSTYWNVTTLTSQWQEFYWPIPVIVKPTSYMGGSQNSWSCIDVVAGNLPQQTAGVDTPWEVVPAGKAFKLPPGRYWMRADLGNPNAVNIRIYPASVDKAKWLSRAFYLPPVQVTVGVASAVALAARVGRAILILGNESSGKISIAFGAAPAVLNSGISLAAGENVTLSEDDCPEDAINAIAAVAGSTLSIQEG